MNVILTNSADEFADRAGELLGSRIEQLLRLAEEWVYVEKVPRIRMAPEPQGRLRFLAENELVRLLAACEGKASKSPVLLPVWYDDLSGLPEAARWQTILARLAAFWLLAAVAWLFVDAGRSPFDGD